VGAVGHFLIKTDPLPEVDGLSIVKITRVNPEQKVSGWTKVVSGYS
jgi:hypothetical protein